MQSLTLREEKKGQSFLAALSFCARLQLDPERGHQVGLMSKLDAFAHLFIDAVSPQML